MFFCRRFGPYRVFSYPKSTLIGWTFMEKNYILPLYLFCNFGDFCGILLLMWTFWFLYFKEIQLTFKWSLHSLKMTRLQNMYRAIFLRNVIWILWIYPRPRHYHVELARLCKNDRKAKQFQSWLTVSDYPITQMHAAVVWLLWKST